MAMVKQRYIARLPYFWTTNSAAKTDNFHGNIPTTRVACKRLSFQKALGKLTLQGFMSTKEASKSISSQKASQH